MKILKKELLILFGVLALIFMSPTLNAQKKDIRLNFGFQGNLPERLFNKNIPDYNNKNGGFGIHLFPKWNYTDNITYGLNMEYTLVIEDSQTDNIGSFNIISFSPTIEYSFTNTQIQPFVGLGLGVYHVLYHTPTINIGFRPLIGISIYDIFDLTLEYNRIFGDINVDPDIRGDFDNYYLSIKGSFSIGLFNTRKNNKP